MNEKLKRLLTKHHYELIGKNAAIKVCEWTKKSLRDEDVCYKQKFYNIQSHRCVQMTPCTNFCTNSCVFCWRPLEFNQGIVSKDFDEPKEMIEECIKGHLRKLTGFGGNEKINRKKFNEAKNPIHFAISLSGEPTIYPKLKELIEELRKKEKTSFLVTNGMFPERLEKLRPTQLYISLTAPNEETYKLIDRPMFRNSWDRLLKSLKIMRKLRDKTRTTIRITLIKNLNMFSPEQYAELIKIANPTFLEVKAYMWVGFSQMRLGIENMPSHNEVKEFALKIGEHCDYKLIDEKVESRVVLLMKRDKKDRFLKI